MRAVLLVKQEQGEKNMNEEIEYAQMLEIPVSTVNIVRKKRKSKKSKAQESALASQSQSEQNPAVLKESVIEQVNGKISQGDEAGDLQSVCADAQLFAESANSCGSLDFPEFPERIDTVRIRRENEPFYFDDEPFQNDSPFAFLPQENENEGGRVEMNAISRTHRRAKIVLGAEFAAACVLCGGIFLTNVFMPNSAINTFFRALDNTGKTPVADARTYADFTLSSVVSDFSSAQVILSPTGILTVNEKCHIYPVADGKVESVQQLENGTYTVKVAHSDSFSGVVGGLEQVYYTVGEEVKSNVPLGYAGGENQVEITMYSSGVLLNCFELTEENTLACLQNE